MSTFKFDPESVPPRSTRSVPRNQSDHSQSTSNQSKSESDKVSEKVSNPEEVSTMPGLATNGSTTQLKSITRNKQSYPILTYLNVFPESGDEGRKISICDSIEEVIN